MSHITIPATGSGDATPEVATDLVSSAHYQYVKLADGTVGSGNVSKIDASGNLQVAIASLGPGMLVGATVANFPANQTVTISGQPIAVSGNVTASVIGEVGASVAGGTLTASVIGYVGASVTNFPATQNVAITGQPISVSGNVTASVIGEVGASIAGGTVTASVIGYVGASLTGTPTVDVGNFPGTQPVSGAVIASVIGYVGASTVPGYQGSVSGYIGASVTNFPGTQTVAGNVTASVIGYVGASVAGPIAATASVIGYVGASLAGTPNVSVSNFPATQPVSGNVTASVIGYVGASLPSLPVASVIGDVVNYGGSITLASAVPGIYIGASIANVPAVAGAASQVLVGGSVTIIPDAAPGSGFGASPYQYITGASFNNLLVKNAAGTLYNAVAMNTNVNPRFLRLFDKGTTPSPGVDVPRQTYVIPGASFGAGAVIPMPVGMLFAAGIAFDVTGGSVGASDTTVTALGDVVVNLAYS